MAGQAPLSYPAALHPFHLKEMLITPTIAPIKAANRISNCRQRLALLYLCDLPFCTCLTTCTNCTKCLFTFSRRLCFALCAKHFHSNVSKEIHPLTIISVCCLFVYEKHWTFWSFTTLSLIAKNLLGIADSAMVEAFSYHTVRTTFAAGYFEIEK